MEDGIKNLLKQIKLNENTISLLLGVAVVAIVGGMIVNYFRETPTKLPSIDQAAVSTALGDVSIATDSAIATGSAIIANAKISPTNKPTATATVTKVPTPTATRAPSATLAPTATIVPTKAVTATQAPTATVVPTKAATVTQAPTHIPTATPATTNGQITSGVTSQQPATNHYTVQTGDNLWKIAQTTYKSGYAWVEIAKANNLKNPGSLANGQVLTMPTLSKTYPDTIASTNTAVTSIHTVAGDKIDGTSYTVVAGDNLWNIAQRAYGDGAKWAAIADANKDVISNPRVIRTGMNLKINR